MKTNSFISLILMGLILFTLLPLNSNAQVNWEKDANNPVMQVEPGTWFSWNVFFPVVIYEDDMFKMWFTGNNSSSQRHIGYAKSTDGIEWDILDDPVISSGEAGAWALHLYSGSVLSINDTLRMWFSGSTNSFDNGAIGYAWSIDNINWNIQLGPVLVSGPSAWDNNLVFHPSVYYDGTMYHMHYYGSDNNFESGQVGYATSFDGVNWEKDSENNPVIPFEAFTGFYIGGLVASQTIMVNDTIRMYFTGMDGTTSAPPYYSFWRVGYAWSIDNINWNIHPDPVVDVGGPGSWDETIVGGPSVVIHDYYYKMWYWGDHYNANWEIGYALGDYVPPVSVENFRQTDLEPLYVYPNPIIDKVILSYTMKSKSMVKIELYKSNGELMAKLVNEIKQRGNHEIMFEGSDLQPGIYFCVLRTNQGIQTKKMIKL